MLSDTLEPILLTPELFLIPTSMGLTFLFGFIDKAAIVAVYSYFILFFPHASSSPLLSHLHFGSKSLDYMLCDLQKKTNQCVASHYVGIHFLSPLDPDHHSGLFWFKQIGHCTVWGTFAEHYLSSLEKFSILTGKWYIPC